MDLWILDENLDAIGILDTYKSMIWTDRYNECGDFEIVIPMQKSLLDTIKQDYYLWRNDSEHSMIIEKILINSDSENGDLLTITGRSLESILDRRVIWGLKNLSGNLQNGIESMLNDCIINPSKPERKISNFIFEATSDPKITGLEIEAQYTGDNLYDVITSLCSERSIGFKIKLNDSKQFVFSLYSGTDRSYDQFSNPFVIFSPTFDNIVDSSYMESRSSLKNVTLVGGEGEGSARRYTAVGNTSGLARREIFTNASDTTSDISEDITEEFTFTQYPSQVFNNNSKSFVTDSNFNSCMVDVSQYAGRTINISIPTYTNASGAASGFATILVDASKKYVATLKVWEKYNDTVSTGALTSYQILLPEYARYIYTSMYSQTAIDNDVYYGEVDDFSCEMVKLSNAEYISALRQRGSDTLSENKEIISFEGEADSLTMFKYGIDFFDGDIVSVSDNYGHSSNARIIEVITSSDEDGSFSIYPTFSTIDGLDIDEDEPSGLLPDGYTRLSYILSDGNQYIDTGHKPTDKTRVVMDVQMVEEATDYAWFYGARTSGQVDAFGFFWNYATDKFGGTYGTSQVDISSNLSETEKLHIDQNKNQLTFNTVNYPFPSSTFSCPVNLTLFVRNTNGTLAAYTKAKLYSCQIYENDILVRDYIPCTNEDGVVGLFDVVDSAFYMNAGTGGFVAGV